MEGKADDDEKEGSHHEDNLGDRLPPRARQEEGPHRAHRPLGVEGLDLVVVAVAIRPN